MKNVLSSKVLYAAMDRYVEEQATLLPSGQAVEGITFSASFEEKMRSLINRNRLIHFTTWNAVARRAACIAVVCVDLAIAVAFGMQIQNAKVVPRCGVSSGHSAFSGYGATGFNENALTNSGIPLQPTKVPAGFCVYNLKYSNDVWQVVYHNKNGYTIDLQVMSDRVNKHTIDEEYSEVEYKGRTLYTLSKGNENFIVFKEDGYVVSIHSKQAMKDLLSMAVSME